MRWTRHGSAMRKTPMALLGMAMLGVLLWAGGCARRGTQPEDMSAEAHRREARQHQAEAEEAGGAPTPADGGVPWSAMSGRKAWQLTDAKAHSKHAQEHREAAQALERFEATECQRVPPDVRPSCPLLLEVDSAEDIPGGVRVHLKAGASVEEVVVHMRCHQAFAASRGFEDMDQCALYLKGVNVAPAMIPQAVDLTAGTPETVAELRRRVARDVSLGQE